MDRQELINSITDENQRNLIKISRLLGLSAKDIHKQLTKSLDSRALPLKTVER